MNAPQTQENSTSPQRATFLQVLRAISFGLLGLRSHANYREELAKISVGQAFLGGIIGVIIFIIFVAILVTLAIKTLS